MTQDDTCNSGHAKALTDLARPTLHGLRVDPAMTIAGWNNRKIAVTSKPEAFFLPMCDGDKGQRFCIFSPAQGTAIRGMVLHIHPFAEEMNKSRRMVALQARALSDAGFAVLQFDLLGCGDSSGDFGDATWQAWVDDAVRACQWLTQRTSASTSNDDLIPLWLWGLRAGCLLAIEAAVRLKITPNFLFWQPVSDGKQLLQQFMRLKTARNMIDKGAKASTGDLHQQLTLGASIDVAGYVVSPGLANGIKQSQLSPPDVLQQPEPPRLELFEMSTREDATASPVAVRTVAKWTEAGFAVRSQVVKGPSFWQTTEIEDAPELVLKTVAAIVQSQRLEFAAT